MSWCQIVLCQIIRGVKFPFLQVVLNCPDVKLSSVKLSAVSNCPVSNCPIIGVKYSIEHFTELIYWCWAGDPMVTGGKGTSPAPEKPAPVSSPPPVAAHIPLSTAAFSRFPFCNEQSAAATFPCCHFVWSSWYLSSSWWPFGLASTNFPEKSEKFHQEIYINRNYNGRIFWYQAKGLKWSQCANMSEQAMRWAHVKDQVFRYMRGRASLCVW